MTSPLFFGNYPIASLLQLWRQPSTRLTQAEGKDRARTGRIRWRSGSRAHVTGPADSSFLRVCTIQEPSAATSTNFCLHKQEPAMAFFGRFRYYDCGLTTISRAREALHCISFHVQRIQLCEVHKAAGLNHKMAHLPCPLFVCLG